MPYSSFFQTLHDETQPVGHLGRGTHYSVLRVPMWQDQWLNPVARGSLLDFAVIWDEDHDERVIEVIEELYFDGLLAPVRFIGERKGSLTVLLEDETVDAWKEAAFKDYRESVSDVAQRREDPWPVRVERIFGPQHSIIHAAPENVATYLKNIHLLWQLGLKPNSALLKSAMKTLLKDKGDAGPARSRALDEEIEF
ncbi:MAG: hypothetical protein ACRELE_10365 [Gemmatimonadales bacterium]